VNSTNMSKQSRL